MRRGEKQHRDAEIRRARSILGIPNTPLKADKVKSPVELAAFKKKVQKVALQVALSVIFLGLEGTGRFSQDELRQHRTIRLRHLLENLRSDFVTFS